MGQRCVNNCEPMAASCGFGPSPEPDLLSLSVKSLTGGLYETISTFKHPGPDPPCGSDVGSERVL